MKTLNEIRSRKKAVFTFGRFNPPTLGHEKLIDKVLEVSRKERADPYVYVSSTQDPLKNPLTQKQKIKYLKLGIPEASSHIVEDAKIRTPLEALKQLEDMGYNEITVVVGEDRVREFEKIIRPYIGHADKSKSFDLDSFKVVSAGNRDPDADGTEGMSASKMRAAAQSGNFENFYSGVPSKLSTRFAREMFDLVRRGLRIAEEVIKLRNTLNIPRSSMPQIKGADIQQFIKDLEDKGIPIAKKDISVAILKPTQKEVNTDKIKKKVEDISNGSAKIKPFIVSADNFILDGHHQLFALKDLNQNTKVTSYVVGIKMEDLLKLASQFPKVTYKQIDE